MFLCLLFLLIYKRLHNCLRLKKQVSWTLFSALVTSDYSSIIRRVDQTSSKNFPAVSGHGVSIIFGADLPVTKQATQGHPFPAMVCAQARPLYATTSN